MKKRLLSGIQTSGNLHLGNYLGAIKNWVDIYEDYDTFLFLADLHAITVPQDPKALRAASYEQVATYLACGLDPKKATIFVQSQGVHTELAWILSCYTPIGWLNRMTQFKDKAGENKEKSSAGLYTYPVLMAADILIYQPQIVPVGEDQKQHIELTRDIAMAYNRKHGLEFFTVPEPKIMGAATRVMSLRDGLKKMSKSDESDMARINLVDNADQISKKIMKAKTDSFSHISYDQKQRPEVSNLINIYAAFSNKTREQIVDLYANKGTADFKRDLAEVVTSALAPISKEIQKHLEDKSHLEAVLKDGAEKANKVAFETVKKVKELEGFLVF